eukprot:INCI11675.1.p1 GENE.INCI11675.1~~INCI11675.1.p1  ORF type:complete len:454 (+),score=62.85 INCI11675.1:147-1508(+)
MRLSLLPFLLVVGLVSCSETSDLRGLVDVLVERNTKLMATIDALRTDLSDLKEKYDALVASTTAQRHEEAQWQRETTEKLQSLAGRRRLSSAVSTQRRGLSSDTCGDPSGPALLVEGVCSCTGGLLVEGRNVTAELDELATALELFVNPELCNRTEDGCTGVTISGFSGTVFCTNSSSCSKATFSEVAGVICGADDDHEGNACQDAVFSNVGTVVCIGNGTDVCRGSTFDNTTTIQCRGSGSQSCSGIAVTNTGSVMCEENSCQHSEFTGVESLTCSGDGLANCYKISCDNVSSVACSGAGAIDAEAYNCGHSTFKNVQHSVTCDGDSGACCAGSTFSNIPSVMCSSNGTWACVYANFSDVATVACPGNGAANCQVSSFYRVNTLICSGDGYGNCHLTELYDVPSVQCIGATSCNPMHIYNTNEVYSVTPCTSAYCSTTVQCSVGGVLDPSNC